MSDTNVIDPEVVKSADDLKEAMGEPETKRYTHIISPPENVGIFEILMKAGNPDPSAQDILVFALKHRFFVVALCGYRWIPTGSGEDLDACQICMDVAGMHIRNVEG